MEDNNKTPPPQSHVVGIKTSIDTMREAAKDLLVKNGWKPGSQLSGHSVAGLMAEFGMRVQAGDVGCDYPDCGCCADAACADAVKQHPDLGGSSDDIPPDAKTQALFAADAWLDRWAKHVGSCRGGQECTCGLTGVRFEVAVAIDADKNGEPVE